MLVVSIQSTKAATNTWNNNAGVGKVSWSDKGNWNAKGNQITPINGDTLTFGFQQNAASYSPSNDILNLSLSSIVFNDTNSANSYNLVGNAIFLTGGISNVGAIGETISMGIILSNNVTFNAVSNALTFAGAISQTNGPWSITKTGASTVNLTTSNSFSGGLLINQGTVAASNNFAFGTGTVTFASNNTTVLALTNLATTNAFVISTGITGSFDVNNGGSYVVDGVLMGDKSLISNEE